MTTALIQFSAALAATYVVVCLVGTITFPNANRRTER